MCLGDDFKDIDPPKWGANVIRQYEAADISGKGSAPTYVGQAVKTSERSYFNANKVCGDMFETKI